ncbi:MAG: DUF5615 family PIN-like protein, partial [Chitinophagaceae bacterium]
VGHHVIWIGEMEKDPGDVAIIRRAYNEKRILITLDKDFGELAILRGFPHSGIIRLVDYAARKQGIVAAFILHKYAEDLMQGAIITTEPGRTRIRPGSVQ